MLVVELALVVLFELEIRRSAVKVADRENFDRGHGWEGLFYDRNGGKVGQRRS